MTCGCRLPHAETVCSSAPKIFFNNYGIFKKIVFLRNRNNNMLVMYNTVNHSNRIKMHIKNTHNTLIVNILPPPLRTTHHVLAGL